MAIYKILSVPGLAQFIEISIQLSIGSKGVRQLLRNLFNVKKVIGPENTTTGTKT